MGALVFSLGLVAVTAWLVGYGFYRLAGSRSSWLAGLAWGGFGILAASAIGLGALIAYLVRSHDPTAPPTGYVPWFGLPTLLVLLLVYLTGAGFGVWQGSRWRKERLSSPEMTAAEYD